MRFSVLFLTLSIVACSSSDKKETTTNTPVSDDAGIATPTTDDVAVDSGAEVEDAGKHYQGECLNACRVKFPSGAIKADGIDACQKQECDPICTMGSVDGRTFAPDSASLSDAGVECKSKILTPTAACSTCTAIKCCAAWSGCFDDKECSSLNDCSFLCWKLPVE